VALKRLSRQHSLAAPNHDLREILSEATKHSKLVHHNIVQVYDFIEADGEPLIVMEFVDGRSLHESLRNRLPVTSRTHSKRRSGFCEMCSRGSTMRTATACAIAT